MLLYKPLADRQSKLDRKKTDRGGHNDGSHRYSCNRLIRDATPTQKGPSRFTF